MTKQSKCIQYVSTVKYYLEDYRLNKEYYHIPHVCLKEAEWTKTPGPRSSWPESGAVEFEGLTMAYRNGAEPALRDVTCSIAPGDKIGIVGRTGAGKSTLTLGLFRYI